jgi:phenylalanyl-tRNA synthetase alpha chain
VESKLEEIRATAQSRVKSLSRNAELEALRLELLGKKGELTQILRGLGALSASERPRMGQLVNETRVYVEELLTTAKKDITARERDSRLSAETIDITMPGKQRKVGHKHPLSIVIDELSALFMGMGYEIAEGPEVELDYYNFEALNIPANHPARDEQDTFYAEGGLVLRTQTSNVQIRTMENKKPPIKIIAPGKAFRSDQADSTHSPVFHQIEGLVVDKGITMGALKGTLITFAQALFGNEVHVRFRPHHFPFTEPSAEMDVECFVCGGKGCRVCKDEGFIELLGCGMVHPRVLQNCGIDPQIYSGFAFGAGLERIAMRRFSINDIRLLYENDARFLGQF